MSDAKDPREETDPHGTIRLEDDADGVESPTRATPSLLGNVCLGRSRQGARFATLKRLDRMAIAGGAPIANLDEVEPGVPTGDQVDLPAAGADIPIDDFESGQPKKGGGEILGGSSEMVGSCAFWFHDRPESRDRAKTGPPRKTYRANRAGRWSRRATGEKLLRWIGEGPSFSSAARCSAVG